MDEEMYLKRVIKVYNDIEKLISNQITKARISCKQSGEPLLSEPLIPEDLRTSTFRLPVMEKKYDEFFDLDKCTEALLEEQLKWAPPGWASPSTMRLRALNNNGEDNCLFHSVSMALWGVNDYNQILRRLANLVLENQNDLLKKTYARGQRKMAARGFLKHASDEEVNVDWDAVCKSAKRSGIAGDCFFLYILSNILRRPIVMHGSVKGKMGLRGIYLPFLIDPVYCYKTPIVVGFMDGVSRNHLASLVGYEGVLSHVSLIDGSGKPLSVWYGVDDEREGCPCPEAVLLDKYMTLTWEEGSDGKKYRLARMSVMKMNAGNDVMMQMAKRIKSLFEVKQQTPKRIKSISEVYKSIEKLISEQTWKARNSCRQSGKPLLSEPLIPKELRTSTFRLPVMEKKFDEFFELDHRMEELLEEQLKWAPPGWTSPSTMRLRALNNNGEDNCLFNSVSIALWGVNDYNQILRRLANLVLENQNDRLKKTYARGQRKMAARGFLTRSSDEEVNEDWDAICKSAKRSGIAVDCFFLYILSNILRRPIVMHGSVKGKIGLRGIYLPSLVDPRRCYKRPIVVGLMGVGPTNHVASLVGYEGVLSHVSLVDGSGKPLPVCYGVDDEREGSPRPEAVLLEEYARVTWEEGSDGKKYPLARMRLMKMNAGNDAMMRTAQQIKSLFEKKEEEQAGSGVGDVRLKAKRRRESNEHDEVELSRLSKRTLPLSLSVSSDVALSVITASPPAADVFSLPSPSARIPRMLLEAQRQNAAFAEEGPETPKEDKQAGSGVDDVRLEAKRKRESNEHDEVELSRSSKRTLPLSPSVSSDVALSEVAASPPAADVFSLPSASAREPRMLLEAQHQNAAFAEGDPETPGARRLKGRRLATACLAAAACFAIMILIVRGRW